MEEKRKYPRFTVNVEVHWKKISGADERTALHISAVKDASVGGICLVLHPGINKGDLLQLDIKIPGNKTIRTKGQVMWVTSEARVKGRSGTVNEGGIQFLDLNENDRKEIEHFLMHAIDLRSRK